MGGNFTWMGALPLASNFMQVFINQLEVHNIYKSYVKETIISLIKIVS